MVYHRRRARTLVVPARVDASPAGQTVESIHISFIYRDVTPRHPPRPVPSEFMSAEDAVKAIRIKTGSLRRLFRERAMYADEVKMGQEKVARMKSDASVDLADLRQQVRSLSRARRVARSDFFVLSHAVGGLTPTLTRRRTCSRRAR